MKIIAESVNEFKEIEKIMKKTACPKFFKEFDYIEFKNGKLIAKVNKYTEGQVNEISLPESMTLKSVLIDATDDGFVFKIDTAIKTISFSFEFAISNCNALITTSYVEPEEVSEGEEEKVEE